MDDEHPYETDDPQDGPSHVDLCQLVLSYLVHYCYKDTAKALQVGCKCDAQPKLADDKKESASSSTNDLSAELQEIDRRAPIYNHIMEGEVEKAILLTNQLAEGMLESRQDIYFELLALQFTELVRLKDVKSALDFAQSKLHHYGASSTAPDEEKSRYLEKLQDLLALLAYEEPSVCPVANYLSVEHRQKVADELNGALLHFNDRPAKPALETVLQQTILTHDKLATQEYPRPRFNLTQYVNKFC